MIDLWNHDAIIAYLNRIRGWFGFLATIGLPDLKDRGDLPVEQIFIPPTLRRDGGEERGIVALLERERGLVVLGGPGSGKSSLFTWLAWSFTSRPENGVVAALGRLVPIPVVVRDIPIDKEMRTFEALLERVRKQPWWTLGEDPVVETLLASGQAIVMVDGLDEISHPPARAALQAALTDGWAKYPLAKFLFTSRVQGWSEWVREGEPGGRLAELAAGWGLDLVEAKEVVEGLREHLSVARDLDGVEGLDAGEANRPQVTPGADEDTSVAMAGDAELSADKLAAVASFAAKSGAPRVIVVVPPGVGRSMLGATPARRPANFVGRPIEFLEFQVAPRNPFSELPAWTVQPFDDLRIAAFARAWYRLRVGDASQADRAAEGLVTAVKETPAVHELARVPNLLTLMALVHRVYTRLPAGRALLYDKISEAYLESIDRARGLPLALGTLGQKRAWLGALALEMQRRRLKGADGPDREVVLSRVEAAAILSEAGADADAFLEWVARRAGLLLPRTEDTLAFSHLSFQEHFAAREIERLLQDAFWNPGAQDAIVKELADWIRHPACRETLVQLFEGLGGQKGLGTGLLQRVLEVRNTFSETEADAVGALLAELGEDEATGLDADVLDQWGEGLTRTMVERYSRLPAWAGVLRQEIRVGSRIFSIDRAERVALETLRRISGPIGLSLRFGKTWPTWMGEVRTVFPKLVLLRLESETTTLAPLSGARLPRSLALSTPGAMDLSPLESVTEIETIMLTGSGEYHNIAALRGVKTLTRLRLDQIESVEVTTWGNACGVPALEVSHAGTVDMSGTSEHGSLREIDVYRADRVVGAEAIGCIETVERLGFTECPDLTTLSLPPSLRRLTLHALWNLETVTAPVGLPSLSQVSLKGLPVLSDLSALHAAPSLKTLTLMDPSSVQLEMLLPIIARVTALTLGDVPEGIGLADLPLGGLTELNLWVGRFPLLIPAGFSLGGALRLLSISGVKGHVDLATLLPHDGLTQIELSYMQVTTLSGLERHAGLQRVDLYDLPDLTDLTALAALPPTAEVTIREIGATALPAGIRCAVDWKDHPELSRVSDTTD